MTETAPHFKYYDVFASLAVAVLLISNTVAQKLIAFGPFVVSVAIILFPITYFLSDILTEVYGYQRARRVTWMMVIAQILMILFYEMSIRIPSLPGWEDQTAFAKILGTVPRISIASILAIWAGDMANCYVLSKMKVKTKGKHLWARIIVSTFIGQGLDSVIVYTVAFLGVLATHDIITAIFSGWFLKTLYEVMLYPLTKWIITHLKKVEGIDHFDDGINYTPFSLEVKD